MELNPNSEVPLLTPEEKRRILARIVRVNPLDCFDESGAFDIARAKRILPPGAVRHIAVHETTRLNAEGQAVTERRINVRLVDPVSALRLDDQLERRRERTASSSPAPSDSDSDSPPPHPASPEYARNLLRKNTIALDEANHTLAQLKKRLAEKEDRKHRLSKELEEKDRLLEVAQRLREITPSSASQSTNSQALQSQAQSREAGFVTPLSGNSKTQNSSTSPLPSRAQSFEGDTGCQLVEPKYQAPPPKTLSPVEGQSPSPTADQTLDKRRAREIQRRNREIEDNRNTSGTLGFANWLRIKQKEWAEIDAQASFAKHHATHHQKIAAGQTASPAARPPPH